MKGLSIKTRHKRPKCDVIWMNRIRTFLTVGLPVLHVEQAVSERFATGGADEAGGVPRLPQSVHHFLQDTTRYRWMSDMVPS